MSSSFVKDCSDASGSNSSSNKTVIIIVNNEAGNVSLDANQLQNLLGHCADTSQVSVVQMGSGSGSRPVIDSPVLSVENADILGSAGLPLNFSIDGFPTIPLEGSAMDGYAELPLDADALQRLESVLETDEAKQILGEPLLDIVNNPDQLVDSFSQMMSPSDDELAGLSNDSSSRKMKGSPPMRRSQRQMDKAEREEVEKILAENQQMLKEERELMKRLQEEEQREEETSPVFTGKGRGKNADDHAGKGSGKGVERSGGKVTSGKGLKRLPTQGGKGRTGGGKGKSILADNDAVLTEDNCGGLPKELSLKKVSIHLRKLNEREIKIRKREIRSSWPTANESDRGQLQHTKEAMKFQTGPAKVKFIIPRREMMKARKQGSTPDQLRCSSSPPAPSPRSSSSGPKRTLLTGSTSSSPYEASHDKNIHNQREVVKDSNQLCGDFRSNLNGDSKSDVVNRPKKNSLNSLMTNKHFSDASEMVTSTTNARTTPYQLMVRVHAQMEARQLNNSTSVKTPQVLRPTKKTPEILRRTQETSEVLRLTPKNPEVISTPKVPDSDGRNKSSGDASKVSRRFPEDRENKLKKEHVSFENQLLMGNVFPNPVKNMHSRSEANKSLKTSHSLNLRKSSPSDLPKSESLELSGLNFHHQSTKKSLQHSQILTDCKHIFFKRSIKPSLVDGAETPSPENYPDKKPTIPKSLKNFRIPLVKRNLEFHEGDLSQSQSNITNASHCVSNVTVQSVDNRDDMNLTPDENTKVITSGENLNSSIDKVDATSSVTLSIHNSNSQTEVPDSSPGTEAAYPSPITHSINEINDENSTSIPVKDKLGKSENMSYLDKKSKKTFPDIIRLKSPLDAIIKLNPQRQKNNRAKNGLEPVVAVNFASQMAKKAKTLKKSPSKGTKKENSVRKNSHPVKKKKVGNKVSCDGKKDESEESNYSEEEEGGEEENSSEEDEEKSDGEEQTSDEEEENSEVDDDPQRLWCLCQKPHNNRFMICCDRCEDWFHGSCVGISKQMGKVMEQEEREWICPNCKKTERAVKGVASSPSKKVKKAELTKKGEQNREEDAKNKTIKTEHRVLVFEKYSGVILSGTAAPVLTSLQEWLDSHPDYSCLTPAMMKVIEEDPKTGVKRIPLEKFGLIPSKSKGSSQEKSEVDSDSSSSLKKQKSPSTTKLLKQSEVESLGGFWKKVENKNANKVSDEKSKGDSSKESNKKSSKDPKKVTKSLGQVDKVVVKSDSILKVRTSVQKMLFEALDKRRIESRNEFGSLNSDNVKSLSKEIEEQLYMVFNKDVGFKYKNRYRSLVFNIRDTKNGGLFRQILNASISPEKLANMTSEEMASKELIEWRQNEGKKELEAIQKHELERITLGSQYILKSHKGEIIIDKGEKVARLKDTESIINLAPDPSTVLPKEDPEEDEMQTNHRNHIYDPNCPLCSSSEVRKFAGQKSLKKERESDSRKDKREKRRDRSKSKDREEEKKRGSRYSSSDEEVGRRRRRSDSRKRTKEGRSGKHRRKDRSSREEDEERDRKRSKDRSSREDDEERKRIKDRSSREDEEERKRSKDRISREDEEERKRSKDRISREDEEERKRSKDRISREDDEERKRSKDRRRKRSGSRSDDRKRKSLDDSYKRKDENLQALRQQTSTSLEIAPEKPSKDSRRELPKKSVAQPEVELAKGSKPPTVSRKISDDEDDRDDESRSHSTVESSSKDSEKIDENELDQISYSPDIPSTPPLPGEIEGEEAFSPATPPLPDEEDRLTPPLPDKAQKVHKSSPPPIWRGFINMMDVAKFGVASFEVSGKALSLNAEVPSVMEVVGRVNPDNVWTYIAEQKKSGSKEILVVRFQPSNEEEKASYIAFYSYMSNKRRYGVIGNCGKGIKDFYIVPLASHQPIPQVLLPLDGPGFEESRPHMLIGVIVRTKRRKMYDPLTETWITNDVAPHIHPNESNKDVPLDPDELNDEEAYNNSPAVIETKPQKTEVEEREDFEVCSPPSDAASSIVEEDKDEVAVGEEDRLDRESMLAELNRQIERDKKELTEMQNKIDVEQKERERKQEGSGSEALALDTSKINIPSNLQEILNSIKQKEEAIKEKENEIKRRLNMAPEEARLAVSGTKDEDLRFFLPRKPDCIGTGKDQDMRLLTIPEDENRRDPRMVKGFPFEGAQSLSTMSDEDLLAKAMEMEAPAAPPLYIGHHPPPLMHPGSAHNPMLNVRHPERPPAPPMYREGPPTGPFSDHIPPHPFPNSPQLLGNPPPRDLAMDYGQGVMSDPYFPSRGSRGHPRGHPRDFTHQEPDWDPYARPGYEWPPPERFPPDFMARKRRWPEGRGPPRIDRPWRGRGGDRPPRGPPRGWHSGPKRGRREPQDPGWNHGPDREIDY